MLDVWLVIAAVFCAILAIRATRLLVSALWLAGTSALIALLLYSMGAFQVAVLELSIGAGLVAVLFIFAISLAGNQITEPRPLIPRPLAWGLIILSLVLLAWLTLPAIQTVAPVSEPSFTAVLWQQRGLDVLVQVVLIGAGVLGILGLLSQSPTTPRTADSSQESLPESRPEEEEESYDTIPT